MPNSSSTTQTAPKIESADLTLGDLFKDFYSVPDFQREYVWEAEHVEKLLTDVLDEFYDEQGRLTGDSEYFIGSVVACSDETGTFQLIDGQQRLTTVYLTVCAIRDQLVELGGTATSAVQQLVKAVSMDRRTMADIPRYRVSLQYSDSHGVLEKIADGETLPTEIPESPVSVKHLRVAYQTVREFLLSNFDRDAGKIKEFLAAFLWRVKLIRIVTPNLAHALKVFETVNDRGVSLNSMDLLKNLLFMRTNSRDYRDLKAKWKNLIDTLDTAGEKPLRFLRYFIMSHHDTDWQRGLREDEIYDWFVKNSETCGIDSNPIAFVDELYACAQAYGNFLKGRNASGEAVPYLENLSLVAGGAVRQHLILLLAGRHLPSPLFAELCRNLENLFFCYLITREPTKTFDRNFARWSKELRAANTQASLEEFLKKNFVSDLASRSNAFDFALSELTQSKIQQYRLRYILAKLTQMIELEAWGNPSHASLRQYLEAVVHIEHILPQNPETAVRDAFDKPIEYDAYVERLGNLTLLENTINSSVSNGPYNDKKPGYRESSLLLTRSLVEKPHVGTNTRLNRAVEDLPQFDQWNSTTIEQRQKMLATLARRVWLPELTAQS